MASSFSSSSALQPLLTQCPLCDTSYTGAKAVVIAGERDGQIVHITCASCKCAIIAVILTTPVGMSSLGMLTDLSEKDAFKFQDAQAISSDEILEFHSVLQNEQGLFYKLT